MVTCRHKSRRMEPLALLCCFLVFVRARGQLADKTTTTNLQTKQGIIEGLVRSVDDVTYTSFLGIPYAMPPVGRLRFAKPVSHQGWIISTVWNATFYRPACIQNMQSLMKYRKRTEHVDMSEDCLYLNLFIPKNLTKSDAVRDLKYPVIILIEGEDFQNEAAIWHEGWRLADRTNVIVATLDYRVDVFGFLSNQEPELSGNYGLWDQRMALHWIWDNIREFGGDPERITIMGGSSGAVCVGLHLVSPKSKGLFVRAISQGGTAVTPSALQLDPVSAARYLAQAVQCPDANSEQMLACLRETSWEEILQVSMSMGRFTEGWKPVIDGDFLPLNPLDMLMDGTYNPVDYLIGINRFAGSSVMRRMDIDPMIGLTQTEYSDILARTVAKYYPQISEQVLSAVTMEYSYCERNNSELGTALVEFLTDVEFLVPADLMSRRMTQANERRVFRYMVTSTNEMPDEMMYVLGDLNNPDAPDRRLSDTMMEAWANFAKFGSPNQVIPGLTWKPYTSVQGEYVDFSKNLGPHSAGTNYRSRQMALWTEYIVRLQRSASGTCKSTLNLCSRALRPLKNKEESVSLALWILAALCLLLLLIILVLTARIYMQPRTWDKYASVCACCHQSKSTQRRNHYVTEPETKKLHPLPYCDDPG